MGQEGLAKGERETETETETEEDTKGGRAHRAAMRALDVLVEQATLVISQSPKKVTETQASDTEEMQDVVPSSTNPEPVAPTVAMVESTSKGDDGWSRRPDLVLSFTQIWYSYEMMACISDPTMMRLFGNSDRACRSLKTALHFEFVIQVPVYTNRHAYLGN